MRRKGIPIGVTYVTFISRGDVSERGMSGMGCGPSKSVTRVAN